jgi:cephalosporin hydroxylase
MWRRYFPRALIVGLDYFDKAAHEERRIRIFRGDQSDADVLHRIVHEIGRPDIVIDDGSHVNSHVIKSFEVLFPLLAANGLYAIEDTQTAYWPEFGGDSEDLQNPRTSMALMKKLVDGLNHEELRRSAYQPTYYDLNITAIHFYHNLVILQKGLNRQS